MHDKDGLDEEIKRKIVGMLHVLFPQAKIYLYGSRARGTYHEHSDIDLALDNGAHNAPLKLGEARAVLAALYIPYTIDLVDVNNVQPMLKDIIMREGVEWKNK